MQTEKYEINSIESLKSALLNEETLKALEPLIQVIPSELLSELKYAADLNDVSLDTEITMRLIATFIEPNAFGFSPLLDSIMNTKISQTQAKLELEARRNAWLYMYQMEKLKLWVEFENKLPKDFKENFVMIDFEKELGVLRGGSTQ